MSDPEPVAPTERPLRADARRNRDLILASASELFATRGDRAEMDQIAEHAGVGMGTLYRHFPSKRALLNAIVADRFRAIAQIARTAEAISDPGEAFDSVLLTYLETADGDAAFQMAILSDSNNDWEGAEAAKAEFREVIARITARAVESGHLRSDMTGADFPLIACGLMSTMYFKPSSADWRRHLELVLSGIRADSARGKRST